jgi:hypothetical protein
MLLMLDRVTGHWPDAGRVGLGRLRAVKDLKDLHPSGFSHRFCAGTIADSQPGHEHRGSSTDPAL